MHRPLWIATLTVISLVLFHGYQTRCERKRRKEFKADLARWEGEGGNVAGENPVTAYRAPCIAA
jgi:hypothetical protein